MILDTPLKNVSIEKKLEKIVIFADISISVRLHIEKFVKNDQHQRTFKNNFGGVDKIISIQGNIWPQNLRMTCKKRQKNKKSQSLKGLWYLTEMLSTKQHKTRHK